MESRSHANDPATETLCLEHSKGWGDEGDTTLAELMLYRSEEFPDAWPYLAAFRRQPHQPPPTDDDLRLLLKRHLLIEQTATGDWQLRVPLMQRWLQERT